MLSIDDSGALVTLDKIKGKKKALKYLLAQIKEKAVNVENEVLYIAHGDVIDEAETLKAMVLEELNFKDVVIKYIGTVLGAHGGPGAIVAVFFADKR